MDDFHLVGRVCRILQGGKVEKTRFPYVDGLSQTKQSFCFYPHGVGLDTLHGWIGG